MSGSTECFTDVRRLLSDAGYVIADSNYNRESLGSWWILLSAQALHRLIWDGKDEWLNLQREAGQSELGESMWEDLWVKKDARQSTPEDLVQCVRESIGRCRTQS